MKASILFSGIKRKIVRIFFIVIISLSPSLPGSGNPIIGPSTILEIYLGNGSWQIELMNNEFNSYFTNLDDLWLVGQHDTAQFISGIQFPVGEVVVISDYSLQTPMTIEQSGDDVQLCTREDNYFFPIGWINWGSSYWWDINAPVGQESLAYQWFSLPYNEWDTWEVKEKPETIGSFPWQVSKRASFSGYILDKNDQPIPDICLDYASADYYFESSPTVPLVYTDSNGYFYSDEMFCKRYVFQFRYPGWDGGFISDTVVNIEPDSANYFVFKLDTLLTGIHEINPLIPGYSITNFPNPTSFKTTFIIESNNRQNEKGVIKIYSEAGFIVDIVPAEINKNSVEINYNASDNNLSSGIYFYNLEVRSKKVASGKMVIR